MLRTALCDLFGIDVPIVQAAMGIGSSAELAAAVSNAGGLGSVGCWRRSREDVARQLDVLRDRTDRPFALNHLAPDHDEAALALTLAARPPVMSFALGDPGDLVERAHAVGSLVMHQVTTVEQAVRAAEGGVDVIIAQGGEAGGFGGTVASLPLVPQVVDAVHPLPVVAAGGIADGRGLAAALVLGAVGVNMGTRFLASQEARINIAWKEMILEAAAEDAVKVDFLNEVMPVPGTGGYGTVLRTLRTAFVDRWQGRSEEARQDAERLLAEVLPIMEQGRAHELLPAAGQSAGLVHEILPAAEIIERVVADARLALEQALREPAAPADSLARGSS
jgi:nitronate monooxygenase/enoyl-[acyl-carrier protein] reductase II